MGLRADVDREPQSLQRMATALWQRLTDAEALQGAGRSTGAAYLFGYVAEMAIKLRLFGHLGLASQAAWPSMKSAFEAEVDRLRLAGHSLAYPLEGHHGLLLYGMVVVKSAGAGWSADFIREYCRRVWQANEHWSFGLRYWPGTASRADVDRLATAAWWLVLH